MLDSNLFWNIIRIIEVIIQCIVFKLLMDEVASLKKSKSFSYILLITIGIIISILNFKNASMRYTIQIYSVLFLFIFCKWSYDLSWSKSLILSVIYINIYYILNYSLLWIIVVPMAQDYNYKIVEIELFIVFNLCLLVIPLLAKKFKKLDLNKKYFSYILIAISGNLFSIGYAFIADNSIFYSTNTALNLLGGVGTVMLPWVMIICTILLVVIIQKIIEDSNIRAENKIMKEKMDMQYKHYLNIQEAQNKTRKLYHDMNNHLICIKSICDNNEVAKNYIESINEELEDNKNNFNTGNMILDIILNEKKSICDENDIKLFADINFEKCNFIEMIDVCSIFANILDNAIEACSKIKYEDIDKEIKIRGTIVKKYFVVKCENSKVNKVVLKNNKFISSKKDKSVHGIGIESVKTSIKKYDGDFKVENLENKFIANIYIPLNQNMTVGELEIPVG